MVTQFSKATMAPPPDRKPIGLSRRSIQRAFAGYFWRPDVVEYLREWLMWHVEQGNLQALLTAISFGPGTPEQVHAAMSDEATTDTVPVSSVVESVLASIREGQP
jgi:hypothetical protein